LLLAAANQRSPNSSRCALLQFLGMAPPDIAFGHDTEHVPVTRDDGAFVGVCRIEVRHHRSAVHFWREHIACLIASVERSQPGRALPHDDCLD